MTHSIVRLPRPLLWTMAFTCGAVAANLYYNQPLLVVIAQDFQAAPSLTGLLPMLTQVGYATGVLLLVPLGDLLEKRRLIILMLGASAIALAITAAAPSLSWLLGASWAIGVTSISAQLIVPFAAQLVAPEARGNVVGIVMSGLLIGVLLARTVSGWVGAIFDWRTMYWLASGLMLLLGLGLSRFLPKSQSPLKVSYLRLIRSLFPLLTQPVLRETALIGAMSFAAFSAFWSTLAFRLAAPPYHYGSEVTGLFGLVGIVGAVAAPIAGKLADRGDPKLTAGIGLASTTLSFLLFWGFGQQLWGLVAGVILLDWGVQSTQISNQAQIYGLPAEFHSRLNALYITLYFVGGAIGSLAGAFGWTHFGWSGVCIASLFMIGVAWTKFMPGDFRK
ncbi:MAG TPA: MFS transporter [Trichocoleus sp.]